MFAVFNPDDSDQSQSVPRMGLLWLLLIPLLPACSSVPQKLNPQVFYKRDMVLNVNGFKGEGVLVVPKADRYDLDIRARGKLDLFTLETCHREISMQDAGEDGWFGNEKRVKLGYAPVNGLENGGGCPVRLGGYERQQGRHSWALVALENDQATLPALVKCNGAEYNSRGVTICQSKAGLIQQIIFPTQVIVNPDPECPMKRPADLMTYQYDIPPKECVFVFTEKAAPHREHQLITVGYSEQLIRGN